MAAKKKPIFNYKKCIGCTICDQACPVSAIEMSKLGEDKLNTAFPEIAREGCIGCGMCSNACPMNAIEMVELDENGNIIKKDKKSKKEEKTENKK